VHLGINLEDVITRAKLSDAFALALQMSGRTVVRVAGSTSAAAKGLLGNPLAKQES
jgi:rsbT co-antagonist protein RsbR